MENIYKLKYSYRIELKTLWQMTKLLVLIKYSFCLIILSMFLTHGPHTLSCTAVSLVFSRAPSNRRLRQRLYRPGGRLVLPYPTVNVDRNDVLPLHTLCH